MRYSLGGRAMNNPEITFVLLCEGPSDEGLVQHLQFLLVKYGAGVAVGSADNRKGTVVEKLRRVLREVAVIDLVFVHRDADSRSPDARISEILDGADSVGVRDLCVAVVPVQMTEAWLLTDENAIRAVVGKPDGRTDLNLPAIKHVESISDPKSTLAEVLEVASECRGRRLAAVKRQFAGHRKVLLERLDPEGPVTRLDSWRLLEQSISEIMEARHWMS